MSNALITSSKNVFRLSSVAVLFSAFVVSASVTPMVFAEHEPGHMGMNKGAWAEKYFEMADVNNDGMISHEEMEAKVREKFAKMDTDGNGELTKDEKEEAWEKFKEEKKAAYANDSEKKSRMWSKKGMSEEKKEAWKQKADMRFEEADSNNNGTISEAEMLVSGHEHFAKADSNSDGMISKEEFKEQMWSKKKDCKCENKKQETM